MRTIRNLALCIPHFAFVFAAALSGVAKTFDVDISTGRPAASNEAYYHGETIEFRAVRGRSVVTNVEYSCVYYQTNGMDSVWWHTDGLVFHPTNDVGAASYRFFLEGRDDLGRDWHANGLLRLLPSPGFTPNTIELPVARLDFAAVEVLNPPYYDKAETEAKIVELAPAPGDYAAVSNAAVYAAITNALQDTALESHASQLSQLSLSLDDKADKKTQGVLSFDWLNTTDNCTLEFDQESEGWNWHGSIRQGGLYKSFRLCYDDAWLFKSWVIMLGGQEPDWQYTNNVPRTTTVLKFGQTNLIRTNETWAEYPVVYADELASTTNGLLRGEYAALTNNAAFTSAVAAVSPPTDISGKQDNLPYPTNAIPYAAISGKPSLATVATSGSYNDLSNKPTIPTVPTEQINAATTTNALQDTAIGDLSNDNAQMRQIVMTWETFLGGSNVVFALTNYLSGAYSLDAAKLRILELRDGAYQEVYNSRDEILLHIDDFSNRYVRVALDAIVDEVAARLASKADKDWGKYTSAGGEAPSNTVYMTAPNTVFAGGLEYERVAVGEGTICVLTTRGAPVWTQGDEGTFKFQDDGGTNYFGFAKTDSYTIGANTDGITVQGGMVTMNYNITMSGRPCVWYKSSLSSGAWEQLNLPDGSPVAGASHAVTWEANPDPGTQVCYVNVGNAPSGFFRATVEVTGEAKFMTNMPADLSGGTICPNTATGVDGVIKPSFNGSSVIWTWSAK